MTDFQQDTEFEKSFLVADIGHVSTTVVLIDSAVGRYRLIARATAPTTIAPPWSDVSKGIIHAIERLADITGRRFLNDRGGLIQPPRQDGSGVDHFTAVISGAGSLQTILIGLFDDVSMGSARKALQTVYTYEADALGLSDTRSEQEQVATIIKHQPDLIMIAGGTDGGAADRLMRLVEVGSVGVKVLAKSKKPSVVFAGNVNLREQVQELFGEHAVVYLANNVRPTLKVERIEEASRVLTAVYDEQKIKKIPGINEMRDWKGFPMQPTAQAYGYICQYLAAAEGKNVLGVDLGSESITIAYAHGEQLSLSIHTDLGMGRVAPQLLDKIDVAQILRWIPTESSARETEDYIYNKSLHPQTIPVTENDLYLEQALAREILRCAMAAASDLWPRQQVGIPTPQFDLLLARGSTLANAPRPGQVLLMLLDALQPTGIFSVALDQYGVLPAIGALAAHEPLAVVQTLAAGVVSHLGWVIAPKGKGQAGKKVLDIAIESERIRFEGFAEYGKIETFPIAPGEEATVTLTPAGRFDIGFGPGKGQTLKLTGGSVGGLVVDARGRPLQLPQDEADRRSMMRKWHWDLGG
jgi:hypothetical protein